MRRFLVSLFLLAALPGVAQAGPWPREPGGVFTSLSAERDRDGNLYSGLYAEYGLSPRNTVGVEIGRASVGETTGLIWLQRALDAGEGPNRFSASLGLGAVERDGRVHPLGQIGAGWGRGVQTRLGDGWITVEGRVKLAGGMDLAGLARGLTPTEDSYLTPETVAKAEVTFGLRPIDGLMVISQLRLERRPHEALSQKLVGSVVQDLVGPAKIELGLILPVAGPGARAVKIGTWLEF